MSTSYPSLRSSRALRPMTLVIQAVVLVAAELYLYATYTGHDAAFHWSTHFLVGVLAALVWHALFLRLRGRPQPGPTGLEKVGQP